MVRRLKKITVTIDDETYRLSRVKAAEFGTSVTALVRAYLISLVQGGTREDAFVTLKRQQDEVLEDIRRAGRGLHSIDNLSREALHERDALS